MVVGQNAQSQKIRGLFDKDRIARAGEQRADKVEPLRSTGGDNEAVGRCRGTCSPGKQIGEGGAQPLIPGFIPVIERSRILCRKESVRTGPEQPGGEQIEVGLADTEIDEIEMGVDLGHAPWRRHGNPPSKSIR